MPEILKGDLRVTFSLKSDHLCLSYAGVIFHSSGDQIAWDHLCPKCKILLGRNCYCEKVILPAFS